MFSHSQGWVWGKSMVRGKIGIGGRGMGMNIYIGIGYL
jgi:hypothetical protein